MSNNLELLYLIEGAQQPFILPISRIFESRPVKANTLRKVIFDYNIKYLANLAPTHSHLTLLKVNVDPNNTETPLPLLRFNGSDVNVEEIFSWETVDYVSLEQLPNQIHLFVKLTDLPDKYEVRWAKLEAAYLVYYMFWAKDLDAILSAVPNHSNFKYLTKEQTVKLKLKQLQYNEKLLLVRNEYKMAYEMICLDKNNKHFRMGGVVITGQPGAGKTCFLYYLLFYLLSKEQPVALQLEDIFVLFKDTGVQLYDAALSDLIIPTGAWLLSDACAGHELPCSSFLTASSVNEAFVVQTTSSSWDKWKAWHKEQKATTFWMEVFSSNEMTVLGTILNFDLERLHNNYHLWGANTRTCILLMDPKEVVSYTAEVTSAAVIFTTEPKQFENSDPTSVSHKLFVVRPASSRKCAKVEFASEHVLGFILRAYAGLDHTLRVRFYRVISTHIWFAALGPILTAEHNGRIGK